MEGMDLRKFQDGEGQKQVASIMGKILSGREGYEAIMRRGKILRDAANVIGHLRVVRNSVLNAELSVSNLRLKFYLATLRF
jgi:hypothetical protein